jgi:membrane protease YdiL (CAAX protease family)
MAFGYTILLFLNEISFVKVNVNLYEIFISILLFIFVAIAEEVMFRGYILRNLMLSVNKHIALIISSLLFALIHLGNPNITWFSFLNIVLAGIFLGLSYIYTKNLWFPIALHLSWNLFQTLIGFKVSGQESYSIIEFNIKENNLLNGGEFGFEGSILSVGFMLISIGIIYKYYKKQENLSVKTDKLQ